MNASNESLTTLDVICQHSRDGTVIPLKIRLQDEEGQFQSYRVHGYRPLSVEGSFTTPDGVYVTSEIRIFECRIQSFGREHTLKLYYHVKNGTWKALC